MRRIAAQADSTIIGDENDPSTIEARRLIDIYNTGLGLNRLPDPGLDTPYKMGSVAQLGYGSDKYVLLRVGPFPDLYVNMSNQHARKGDEASSLIAAEASNGKFTGFASTFASYAGLLSSFPRREEEAKDAARMCLRLPIPSIGLEEEDVIRVAMLSKLITVGEESKAMEKLNEIYEKIRSHEQEDEQARSSMTPAQLAIEEVNYLLDKTVFEGERRKWRDIRRKMGVIYASAGMEDMAHFVDSTRN